MLFIVVRRLVSRVVNCCCYVLVMFDVFVCGVCLLMIFVVGVIDVCCCSLLLGVVAFGLYVCRLLAGDVCMLLFFVGCVIAFGVVVCCWCV